MFLGQGEVVSCNERVVPSGEEERVARERETVGACFLGRYWLEDPDGIS